MSEFVVDKIKTYADSLLPSKDLELFDIQFRQEDRGWILRVYIDSSEGVSLDDCVEVSRELSAWLEVEDFISHAYHLEVSSPGLERPLRNSREFDRFTGKHAKIKLHNPLNGQKVFIGTIDGVTDEGVITFNPEEGESFSFVMDDINQARLYLK